MNTGFSVLTREILLRLHATGKYELAEYGSYAQTTDARAAGTPWKFYGAIPEQGTELYNKYNSSVYGQFGETLFEHVCLDFKPDIVVDVRDWWMCEFELRSPFSDKYKLVWMPTIDGEPQKAEWLDSYKRADAILTYSHYGKSVLEREAPGLIDVKGIVSPGVNHEIYKPVEDKKKHRKKFGIDKDINIIMAVMRNQRRKLYPDLIEAFKEFLDKCEHLGLHDMANKTYLYLHTSYPDVGFDISRHIMNNGVGHRVLMTYSCPKCKAYYPSYFQTELAPCRSCGSYSSHMPNTNYGLSRQQLADIYNLADLYVQYSICEGYGMPIAEAKACGIPAIGVDYSAISEQVNVEGCSPIAVEKFFYEPVIETEQKRALPNNSDFVAKAIEFLGASDEEKANWAKAVREDVVKNCSFDRSAQIFENVLDDIEIKDRSETWDKKDPVLAPSISHVPNFVSNKEFIEWCIENILGRVDLVGGYWCNDMIKSLNCGFITNKGGRSKFDRNLAVQMLHQIAQEKNGWELERVKEFVDAEEVGIRWELV